ncbi:MAG: zinc ribbon domain-containing protein [Chloroflexi bacterium]|nr:zinc ribbon domain-containing protein [Chloroflexota bacterium]
MPVYEYQCGECCHTFERRQRFDEEAVAMCPSCGGKSRRVIHAPPIIFKGSGFYVTDNRKAVRPGLPAKTSEKVPTGDQVMKNLSAADQKAKETKD